MQSDANKTKRRVLEKYRPFTVKGYVYQGSGSICMIPKICEAEGWKKLLLVIDPGILSSGSADSIIKVMEEAGLEYKIFSEIKPNPLQVDIEEIGLKMYREMKADAIIAVGGGSAMDSAKGIAMIGDSDMTIDQIEPILFNMTSYAPCPWKTYPMICIPTTCGTGSEVIRNAVITDKKGHKMVPKHDCILPQYAIEDPDLLATLPAHVAAATAMDALVQAIESYVCRAATEFSELCALHAIELIGPNIVRYVRNPAEEDAADLISRGAMFAGISWNCSSIAQIHASNHPITELLHISHGDACAILLPWFVEWNGENKKEKFWKVHNAMYPEDMVKYADFDLNKFVKKLMKLNYDLNILNNLTMDEYVKSRGNTDGCPDEICDKIVDMQFAGRDLPGYPRKTSDEQMKKALQDVNHGKYIYHPEN